ILSTRPHRVADRLPPRARKREPLSIAIRAGGLKGPAESERRRTAGVLERQPPSDMIRAGQLEMGRHFVRQLVVESSAMKQREQPGEEGSHFSALESSKNLVTMPAARFQSAASAVSCRSPRRVIE